MTRLRRSSDLVLQIGLFHVKPALPGHGAVLDSPLIGHHGQHRVHQGGLANSLLRTLAQTEGLPVISQETARRHLHAMQFRCKRYRYRYRYSVKKKHPPEAFGKAARIIGELDQQAHTGQWNCCFKTNPVSARIRRFSPVGRRLARRVAWNRCRMASAQIFWVRYAMTTSCTRERGAAATPRSGQATVQGIAERICSNLRFVKSSHRRKNVQQRYSKQTTQLDLLPSSSLPNDRYCNCRHLRIQEDPSFQNISPQNYLSRL